MAYKDPVCGMNVEERSAGGKSDYQGTTYYFCSSGCKTRFDRNPQQYASPSAAQPSIGEESRR